MRTPVRKWETRVVSKRSTFELDEKSATGKDESLEDSANLPDPDIIAQEIVEDSKPPLPSSPKIASNLKR